MTKLSKRQIRQLKIEKLKSYNKRQKHTADVWLANQLYQSNFYQHAEKIGFVLSMAHEVNTYPIINYALLGNKKVFVPETDYHYQMTFKRLLNLDNIEKDSKGIYHSISNSEITNDLDLVVVPGIAFEKNGYRIGYGGGYYDKFLEKNKVQTISLLYDFQLTTFEKEPFDQPVDHLIIYNNDVVEE